MLGSEQVGLVVLQGFMLERAFGVAVPEVLRVALQGLVPLLGGCALRPAGFHGLLLLMAQLI